MSAVVLVEGRGQLLVQMPDDLGGGYARRNNGQQAVASVIPRPHIGQLLQGRVRHAEQRFPDHAAIFVGARMRPEPNDVAEDDRAVLPVQRLRVLRRPLCGRGPVACGRLTSRKAGEGIIAVPGGIFGTAVLELTPHDVEHRWMCADEGREIRRPHHQGAHRFQGDHTGGTDADLQRGTFTDQLARSALGENAFPAVLVDADLSAAAEDHDHVICLTTFLDQPGPGRERSRRRNQPERVPLDGVQRLPEDHRGADGSFGSQRRPGRPGPIGLSVAERSTLAGLGVHRSGVIRAFHVGLPLGGHPAEHGATSFRDIGRREPMSEVKESSEIPVKPFACRGFCRSLLQVFRFAGSFSIRNP